MSRWIGPEINNPRSPILIVGRDPGSHEMSQGRPFVGPAGAVLNRCLGQAGLRREDVNIANIVGMQPPGNDFHRHSEGDVERGRSEIEALVRRLRPRLLITLGNEASYTLVPDWPSHDGTVRGATGIMERRGYVWEGLDGIPVLSTTHPAALLHNAAAVMGINSVIGEILLTFDLEKGKEFVEANPPCPDYDIQIVDNPAAAEVAKDIIRYRREAACDIEIWDEHHLQCVGFAVSPTLAYVFTEATFLDAFDLLQDPELRFTFHNGQFDLFFLRSRYGIEVPGYHDDTIIRFHCCWPELAGKGEVESRSKRTQKSLRFLASLYLARPRWWKDYSSNAYEMYILNGIDCCVTYEIEQRLREEMKELGICDSVYRNELALVPIVVSTLQRGIAIDVEKLDRSREELLERRSTEVERLSNLVEPILTEARSSLSKPHLIWEESVCPCCRNGKAKRVACWSCAGFDSKPGKKELAASGKELQPCSVCDGVGKWERFVFNPESNDQKKMLLYEALGIPPRYEKGKVTTNEEKLKDILGGLG